MVIWKARLKRSQTFTGLMLAVLGRLVEIRLYLSSVLVILDDRVLSTVECIDNKAGKRPTVAKERFKRV